VEVEEIDEIGGVFIKESNAGMRGMPVFLFINMRLTISTSLSVTVPSYLRAVCLKSV